jgi:hypothetical protein
MRRHRDMGRVVTPIALFDLTARLRRQFPRHDSILALCDEAERLSKENRLVVQPSTVILHPVNGDPVNAPVNADPVNAVNTARSAKEGERPTAKSNMAAYMRARRARLKAEREAARAKGEGFRRDDEAQREL